MARRNTEDFMDNSNAKTVLPAVSLLDADRPWRCVNGRRNHNYGIGDQTGYCLDCERWYVDFNKLREAASRARRKASNDQALR